MTDFVMPFIALVAGGCIGYAIRSARQSAADRRMEQQYKALYEEKERIYKSQLDHERENSRRIIESLRKDLNETVAMLQRHVEVVASGVTARVVRDGQKELQDINARKIEEALNPINATMKTMKEAMEANTRRQAEFSGIFSTNIENLLRQSQAARLSADRLANALGRNTKVQGDWGETVLTELLEAQGLTRGIHFDTQEVIGATSSLRPDVILHLDRQRDVIIDSKVSMSSFLDYLNAESAPARESALRNHVASIEKHVRELEVKNYSALIPSPRRSIGYVIMFVPNTSALLLATSHKPELWRNAMERNVYIADEQTLYAALKIVHLTWSQITQNENHQRVFALANEMLDRVGTFMEKYAAIGKSIDALVKSYDEGYRKIQENGHSIPQTCRKLIKMGAKMERRKNVPDPLLGLASSDEDVDDGLTKKPEVNS